MYAPRKKILWFAITTRIIILILQVIFNLLIPDHHADAFKRPLDSAEKVSLCDRIIYFLFNGLTRWDGEYFLHIARYGYTYENTLAFYPLYPAMIHIIAVILTKIFPLFNIQSTMILAAILINFVCFVKSAIIFYDLTERVFQNTITAYKAAILYCINPASIFFSALYSESVFAYLTFYTMLGSIKGMSTIYFPLALSTLVRSNGIVNIGFPMYFGLKNLCNTKRIEKHQRKYDVLFILWHILKLIKLKNYFTILSTIIISLFPLVLLQIYNYMKFCISTYSDRSLLPVHILQYAIENNLILPGMIDSTWCNASLPLAYSYVQKTYWNVGFLRYYQFKQIPNFILSLPILYIMLQCIKEFVCEYKDELHLLGFFNSKAKNENTIEVKKYPLNMFVFVIHGLFLTMFCLFFVHIQVSTRLLASATPLPYWYCALTVSHKCIDHIDLYESDENMCSKWKVFFLFQKEYTLQDKFILFYFIGYTIIGCFMFSNFLPWT